VEVLVEDGMLTVSMRVANAYSEDLWMGHPTLKGSKRPTVGADGQLPQQVIESANRYLNPKGGTGEGNTGALVALNVAAYLTHSILQARA
jgi:hypothetical protein